MDTKKNKEETECPGIQPVQPVQPDVIITPHNKWKAMKRIGLLLKDRDSVKVGMTLKNEYLFREIMRDLSTFDFMIKEVENERREYKANVHDAICITIKKIGKHK